MGKFLVILGVLLIVLLGYFTLFENLPACRQTGRQEWGKYLLGDIFIEWGKLKIFIPLASCLVLSLLLTLLFNLISRR